MTPRQTIAHYRITAKLGEGGMGEVWRATDTKLGREVAIKILPEAFAQDTDRLARFRREAQVLASLNHPNIAVIYGVEERALVMELVEGPTLAERIQQGPLPVAEVLGIARQIAEALEAAHEKGVVHRDLKPANIKLTAEGRVKVLDFGLAKAMAGEAVSSDPVDSPTLTMRSTMAGVIMGTAGYMAPEQARGKAVDKRVDIWAFGVVLYEMLARRHLFVGETVPDTLAAVLAKEPDWQALPADVAPNIRTMLRRCLERDARRRLRDIGDARLELEQSEEGTSIPAQAGHTWPLRLVAGMLALGLMVTGAGWWRAMRPREAPLMRFSADMGSGAPPSPLLTEALSLDGRRVVHLVRTSAGTQLAARLLYQSESTILPGTEDGQLPFFSPDGQWIGFFAGGKLKKVSVLGGAPVTLSEAATGPRGGWWAKTVRSSRRWISAISFGFPPRAAKRKCCRRTR